MHEIRSALVRVIKDKLLLTPLPPHLKPVFYEYVEILDYIANHPNCDISSYMDNIISMFIEGDYQWTIPSKQLLRTGNGSFDSAISIYHLSIYIPIDIVMRYIVKRLATVHELTLSEDMVDVTNSSKEVSLQLKAMFLSGDFKGSRTKCANFLWHLTFSSEIISVPCMIILSPHLPAWFLVLFAQKLHDSHCLVVIHDDDTPTATVVCGTRGFSVGDYISIK